MTPMAWPEFSARIGKWYADDLAAPATLTKVRQVLKELGAHCASTADLDDDKIGDWRRSWPERSGRTMKCLASFLKKFCGLAIKWGLLDRSPFDGPTYHFGRQRRAKARPKRHLSRVEMATLLAHLERDQRGSWEGGRLYALAMLLCHTGLRAKEALRLEIGDVDWERCTVSIVARQLLKTQASEAVIPIPPACMPALREWRVRCGSRQWLFPGKKQRGPWVYGSNSKRPADYLNAAGIEAGLPPGTTLLMLRHSLATHARTHFDLSPKSVQQILRHADVRTQDHYIERDLENLKEAVARIDFRVVA